MSPRAITPPAATATPVPSSNRPSVSRARTKTRMAGAVSAEDRSRYIAEAAYFRAEKRGFAQGNELDDWFAAEAEIDALLDTRGAG